MAGRIYGAGTVLKTLKLQNFQFFLFNEEMFCYMQLIYSAVISWMNMQHRRVNDEISVRFLICHCSFSNKE